MINNILEDDLLHYLYQRKLIQLKAVNKNKKLEMEYVDPFYHIKNKDIKVKMIYFSQNHNSLNEEIWKSWNKKYDLFIISFKDYKTNISNVEYIIRDLPKFPIYYEDYVIITPILYYFINGFSTKIKDKNELLNDFFSRIALKLGVIFSSKYFKYPQKFQYDASGIHDFFKDKFLSEPNVFKVDEYMVNKFETNDFGWFSSYNHLMADYLFENFKIKCGVEFGVFMGYSTYTFLKKNPNMKYYCFDGFNPLFLTDYISREIKPDDIKFHYKFMRFETFHANVKEYKNVYTIVGDLYKNMYLLKKHNINPDFIYVDFEKDDNKLIKFVDKLFNMLIITIIFGDDAVHLNESLKYFKRKYNTVIFPNCYLCSKNVVFSKVDELYKVAEKYKKKVDETNVEKIQKMSEFYKINYITRLIDQKEDIQKVVYYVHYFNIDLNKNIYELENNDTLFHYVCKKYHFDDKAYSISLYIELTKLQNDKNILNNYNLVPYDYINYKISKF